MTAPPNDRSPRPGAPHDDPEEPRGALMGVLRKLSRLSGTLGEIDDWLESRGGLPPSVEMDGASRRGPVTLTNIEEHVARESRH